MNKNTFTKVTLEKGEVNVYDFGSVKLHAYRTDDPLSDEVFVVEKNGRAVVIESPCFYDNEKALGEYVKDMNVEGMIIAYHAAGGKFLEGRGVKKYATERAKEYGEHGGGSALINNFVKAFGKDFDGTTHEITEILSGGKTNIGGIDFIIVPNEEAFNIEIPEINAVYAHMLGHDCHSIVAGEKHADAIIAELEGYTRKGFTFILTSHYTPEDLKDAETKINYIKDLKEIAKKSESAEEFKKTVKERYPNYGGENYLEMTAATFFKQN